MALLSLGLGWLVTAGVRIPKLATALPRHRVLGIVLGVAILCWCAYDGAAMLPPNYTVWCWCLVPVCVIMCALYLDFLFARALGGLLIILPNYLIQHAFGSHCGLCPLYALVCLLFGVAGLFLVAWPWKMRNVLEFSGANVRFRRVLLVVSIASAFLLALLPFVGNK